MKDKFLILFLLTATIFAISSIVLENWIGALYWAAAEFFWIWVIQCED